ncbi:cell division protein FtsL [Sodalis sp. CWE]|uniref:cell division protein FtsL n=1 Tax=Sodalis sp. CWE TaxID=2803816 RepID=UPI001C7D13E8|nr:cell division protein FtsL [Sodalis sp. CWE]MBX4180716.1 cell division protein FtsL [Sodalis sp. CWE]
MTDNKRFCLMRIIGNDLLCHSKLSLLLLVASISSALMIISTTYQIRYLTTEHEKVVLEKDELEIEWRNLILEEKTLENHNRIECIAIEQLKMQHIDPSQENIIAQSIN